MIEDHDLIEEMIAAEMIEMRMRIDDGHRQGRQLLDDSLRIADAAAGIDEDGAIVAQEQVQDGMLVMARLHDGIEIIGDLHDLEPVVIDCDAFRPGEGWFRQLIQHLLSKVTMLFAMQPHSKRSRSLSLLAFGGEGGANAPGGVFQSCAPGRLSKNITAIKANKAINTNARTMAPNAAGRNRQPKALRFS